jgi:hypothetical protein
MFNRKTVLLAALIAGILVASGALAMLTDAKGGGHGPTPPQIDAMDLMSKATGLPDQKIENLF